MQIKLWKNFNKRKNSTKRPSDSDSITKEVKLKETTSIESPHFILNGIDFDFNYLKWRDHYYFIDDITLLTNNHIELTCSQDVLATYKTQIGAYNTFVERSQSLKNQWAPDSAVTRENDIGEFTQTSIDLKNTSTTSGIPNMSETGCYIVRIVTANVTSNTGLATYIMDPEMLKGLLNFMFDDQGEIWQGITDDAVKTVFNPFQYISSILWVPYTAYSYFRLLESHFITVSSIKLGWWTYSAGTGVIAGYLMKSDWSGTHSFSYHISTPATYYNDWRRYSNSYTKFDLLVPGIGVIPLDSMFVRDSIMLRYRIDIISGQAIVSVTDSTENYTIYTNTIQYFIPVQLSQINGSGASLDLASSAISTIGGAVTGAAVGGPIGAVVGGIAGFTSSIGGLMDDLRPSVSTIGSTGNRAAIIGRPFIALWHRAYYSADAPVSSFGNALYKNVTINTLSGFVKCGNASLSLAGLSNDTEAVNRYLNSGFYYE